MNFTTLILQESDGIALLTLNRPDKRNAISYELIADLQNALDTVRTSSSQILIITGAGKAFSSGMDLENLKSLLGRTREQNIEDSRTMARLFRSIYDFPKVTIAAVNGPAIAGGTGIATICDFTVASTEAKFGYTEVRIGFVPAIVSTFLIHQVGEKHARDLLLTGAFLHDIGKIYELSYSRSFSYTTRGQLLGHMIIELEMLHKKIALVPGFPEELKVLVEHLIISHHGEYEFGSPKLPMFPEALMLHYLDDLDSKMESMRAHFEREAGSDSEWTSYNSSLGRTLLNTQKFLNPKQEEPPQAEASTEDRQEEPQTTFATALRAAIGDSN